MATGNAMSKMPDNIVAVTTILPCVVFGVISPKPTVVIVTIAHQKASTMEGKSKGESCSSQQRLPSDLSHPSVLSRHSCWYTAVCSSVRFLDVGQLNLPM